MKMKTNEQKCYMSMLLFHHGCSFSMFILCANGVCPCLYDVFTCFSSMLLIHAAYPCCMSTLYCRASCPCCMSILHEYAARTCCVIMNMNMQISFFSTTGSKNHSFTVFGEFFSNICFFRNYFLLVNISRNF